MKIIKANCKNGKVRVTVKIRNKGVLDDLKAGKSGILVRLDTHEKVSVGLYIFPESMDVLLT